MKYLIITTLMFFMMIESANANKCSKASFREENICIISGGAADTNKTVNLAHARSLSLRNARILAYEKMAERLKGVIIGSKSEINSDLLSTGEIKTIVQATLENVEIQKESVSFLSDGSPWAEVTLSAPKKGKYGVETKVLEYTNGQNNSEESTNDATYVIDLRDFSYKKSHFFTITENGKEVFKFNNFLGNVANFERNFDKLNQGELRIIKPTSVDGANIAISEIDSKKLIMANYKDSIVKNKRLIFLTK